MGQTRGPWYLQCKTALQQDPDLSGPLPGTSPRLSMQGAGQQRLKDGGGGAARGGARRGEVKRDVRRPGMEVVVVMVAQAMVMVVMVIVVLLPFP